MTTSAAPWNGSLPTLPEFIRPRGLAAGILSLWLTACSSLQPAPYQADYEQALAAMPGWTLQGRLNIRNSNDSDTININWQQDGADFEISLSGTLGLGAVRLSGGRAGVLIERAGEAPQTAASLEAVGTDTLGYAFPAEQLLFWIRGLSAPGGRAEITRNPEGLVATLSQPGGDGRRWELQYDRYRDIDGHILPGRIRLEQSPWRLTFVVSDWILPGESP